MIIDELDKLLTNDSVRYVIIGVITLLGLCIFSFIDRPIKNKKNKNYE